jgi:YD repeat-containing protein
LVIDAAQHNRLQYTDGAERLKEVDENASSVSWHGGSYGISGPTLQTIYAYDPLDDLTSVSQSGQSRTFTYDSIKRLVQSTNPENGTL